MYTYLWLWTTKLNLRIEVRFGWKHYSCQLMISVSGLCSFTSAYFWYPLAIYANQHKSITVMITSEGCWVFVMQGNMTCPQTMGCWFLHEANPAFDRQLPFCRFRFNFDEDHSSSSPVCPDSQEIFLCFRGTACFVSHRLLSPRNKWWYADLTFWTFCAMVAWCNTAEEFGDSHKSKQPSRPSLNN